MKSHAQELQFEEEEESLKSKYSKSCFILVLIENKSEISPGNKFRRRVGSLTVQAI